MHVDKPGIQTLLAATIATAVLGLSGIGATWAFLTSAESKVVNEISVADCRTSLIEDFRLPGEIIPGSKIVKEVRVRNEGNTACFVRALIRFEDGGCEAWADIAFDDIHWKLGNDGFRYLREPLEPGKESEPVCTEVTISPKASPDQLADFNVIAFCEAIPTTDENGSVFFDAEAAFAERKMHHG